MNPTPAHVALVGPLPPPVVSTVDRLGSATTVSVAASPGDVDPAATVVVAATSDPVSASRTIAERTSGRASVLLFTDVVDDRAAMEAVSHGVLGYVVLPHDRPGAGLLALHRVLRGESYASAHLLDGLLRALRQAPPPGPESAVVPALSAEEHQILLMLAGGMTNQRVGRRLSVSEGTVRNRLAAIYAKLQVERRSEAIATWSRLHADASGARSGHPWRNRILPTSGDPRLGSPPPGSTQLDTRACEASADTPSRSAPMLRTGRTGSGTVLPAPRSAGRTGAR